jgi:hypothetical protein
MRVVLAVLLVFAGASVSVNAVSGAQAASEGLPAWLQAREKGLLKRCFLGADPRHAYAISYPRKIAVVFAFQPPVVTKTCMPPGRLSAVHVNFARASFERRPPHHPGAPFLVCPTLKECSYR